jgi:hypothetical protein
MGGALRDAIATEAGQRDGITKMIRSGGDPRGGGLSIERGPILITGGRPWFACPHCRRRVGRLYNGGSF